MRLGTLKVVFLVLWVIRAIVTCLRFAPNETRGAGHRVHVRGMILLSIVTTARWQPARTVYPRTSTVGCAPTPSALSVPDL